MSSRVTWCGQEYRDPVRQDGVGRGRLQTPKPLLLGKQLRARGLENFAEDCS